MPFQRPVLSRSRLAISALAMAVALAAPAAANPRSGAPIVYRGDAAPAAAPVRMAQTPVSGPVDKATARIDFRYPDQSGAGGVVTASAPPALAAPAAREPVRTEAPQLVLSPSRTVVETTALQSVPQSVGQGAPAVLTPAQPTAPAVQGDHVETGVAVVYGEEFAGLPTANGETFSQSAMTAAHPSLPLPSLVHVTHLETGREVVVRVNDRGPFEDGANLQLSRQAATALGFNGAGKANVRLRYLGPAPVQAASAAPQPAPAPALAPAPAMALASAPPPPAAATPTRRDVVWPVAAEDELMGGNGAAAPAPRLMTLRAEPVKPAPSASPAATYTAPVSGSGVYVQLASFTELGNAEAMLRRVEGQMPVEIVSARVNGADYFRVRVGPFDNRGTAEQVRERLFANGTADGRVVSGS